MKQSSRCVPEPKFVVGDADTMEADRKKHSLFIEEKITFFFFPPGQLCADCSLSMPRREPRVAAAVATQSGVGTGAESSHRSRQPVGSAVARMRHGRARGQRRSAPPSPRDAAGRHVAGSQHWVRRPDQNPPENHHPPPADRHGVLGSRVRARSSHAGFQPGGGLSSRARW